MNRKSSIGILMILFGIMWFLVNSRIIKGEFFLLLVSFGFFIAYIFTGNGERRGMIGFLIPACITLSIGSFSILENNIELDGLEGTLFFAFLGTAFLGIYLIHTIHQGSRGFGAKNWPLITAISIYGFAAIIFMIEAMNWRFMLQVLSYIWPVGLIAAGVVLFIWEFIPKTKNK